MAAPVIRMTPAELRDGATFIEGRRDEIMNELTQMNAKVQEVVGNWEGSAQVEFFNTFQTLYDQISTTLPQTTDGICSLLRGAADGLEQADESIAGSMRV